MKQQDKLLVKAFLQVQILLETLDELADKSTQELKSSTKNYMNILKNKAEPVIQRMWEASPETFEIISNDMRKSLDKVEEYA